MKNHGKYDRTSTINIAHVTLSMDSGGIEKFILEFARALPRQKYNMTVVCLDKGGVLLDAIHSLGCDTHIFNRRPGVDWQLILTLARYFSNKKFKVVHTHNQASHFYGGIAAFLSRIPCILTTEHSRHYIRNSYIRRCEKYFLSLLADAWINVSNELASDSIKRDGVSPKKVKVILNGINIEEFVESEHTDSLNEDKRLHFELGIPINAKILIMVARLHPIKNHQLLIRAISKLKVSVDDIHCVFVGDGEIKQELHQLAFSLDCEDKIHFLGYRKDIQKLLWGADIFVLCSKTEGMPLSLLEALAASIPVIITNNANRAALIINGVNGVVIENNIEELAAAIQRIIKEKSKYKIISQKGFDFVNKHFSIFQMMNKYLGVYENILINKSIAKN